MKDEKAIGIDIGGTNFRIGAVSRDGSVEHFEKISSQVLCGPGEAVEQLETQIREYLDRYQLWEQTRAVGIGFPSPVDAAKEVVYNCPNLQNESGGFDGRNVVRLLEEGLKLPVYINKDYLVRLPCVHKAERTVGAHVSRSDNDNLFPFIHGICLLIFRIYSLPVLSIWHFHTVCKHPLRLMA